MNIFKKCTKEEWFETLKRIREAPRSVSVYEICDWLHCDYTPNFTSSLIEDFTLCSKKQTESTIQFLEKDEYRSNHSTDYIITNYTARPYLELLFPELDSHNYETNADLLKYCFPSNDPDFQNEIGVHDERLKKLKDAWYIVDNSQCGRIDKSTLTDDNFKDILKDILFEKLSENKVLKHDRISLREKIRNYKNQAKIKRLKKRQGFSAIAIFNATKESLHVIEHLPEQITLILCGVKTDFSDCEFNKKLCTKFKGALFLSKKVIFDRSVFCPTSQSGDLNKDSDISFRDCNFICELVCFNYATIKSNGSEKSVFSFEDAVFNVQKLSFDYVHFHNTILNFYQTIFNQKIPIDKNIQCIITFNETIFDDSKLFFEDAYINLPIEFSSISSFPETNFLFKMAIDVRIYKCILTGKIKIGNTVKLSFKRTDFSSWVETYTSDDNTSASKNDIYEKQHEQFKQFKYYKKDRIKWFKKVNHLIVRAIAVNDDDILSKSSQLAMLKESLHASGQYYPEDEAFVLSMYLRTQNGFALNSKLSWENPSQIIRYSLLKFAGYATDYFTSPLKTLKSITVVFVCFFLLCTICFYSCIGLPINDNWYIGQSLIYSLSALFDTSPNNYVARVLCQSGWDDFICVVGAVINWSALGALLTSLVRKTLR